MEVISPSEISGRIMTLIEEADEKLILISPYYQISKWYKLLNRLKAIKSNVRPEIYVRANEANSIREIRDQGFSPSPIPYLHTKLYLNEKEAIVSSMNLTLCSDNNSLDIGLITENDKEYNQLFEYYERSIKRFNTKKNIDTENGRNSRHQDQYNNKQIIKPIYFNWRTELEGRLYALIGKRVYIKRYPGSLKIEAGNTYTAFIDNRVSNVLTVVGVLSGKEFEFASYNMSTFQSELMKVELVKGYNRNYDTICGTIKNIKSWSIEELVGEEQLLVVNAILKFVSGVNELKSTVFGSHYSS